MPLPAIWGPLAWKLLHAIGARAGSSATMKKDESRECLWLLSHLEYIIPCPECRLHIIQYRKSNSLPDTNQTGAWLWTFHEAVNERLKKPEGPPFTHTLGKADNPVECWKVYKECVKECLIQGQLLSHEFMEWGRHFLLWRACL